MINGLKHPVLDYVGAKVSLEMQTPKLLWLKKNRPNDIWKKATDFFDLADFLTFKVRYILKLLLKFITCGTFSVFLTLFIQIQPK